MTKQFYWDEDTLNYFANLEELNGMNHVSTRILEFIETDCTLEDGETVSQLYNSIMSQVEDLLQTKYE